MDLVSATIILSTESLFALVMAIINIRIIFKLIALVWGKGCTIQQVIDIYDLGGKYSSWLRLDCVLNLVFCFLASHFLGGQWGWGAIPIEMFAAIALPIRFMAAKVSIMNNPNLLDFNGKYKGTFNEYKSLLQFLDENKLNSYKGYVSNLWRELLLLNKRRKNAYDQKKKLLLLKEDVSKLIADYTLNKDEEKLKNAQTRLANIVSQESALNDFSQSVEEQLKSSETVFIDIRTKLQVGQGCSDILPDIDNYTNKVKALEFTVKEVEGREG